MNYLKKTKCLFLLALFIVILSSSVFAYNDVGENHWAYQAIEAMRLRGILDGYPDGNFYPSNYVTREEFAKIVVKTLNITERHTNIKYEDIEENRDEELIQSKAVEVKEIQSKFENLVWSEDKFPKK